MLEDQIATSGLAFLDTCYWPPQSGVYLFRICTIGDAQLFLNSGLLVDVSLERDATMVGNCCCCFEIFSEIEYMYCRGCFQLESCTNVQSVVLLCWIDLSAPAATFFSLPLHPPTLQCKLGYSIFSENQRARLNTIFFDSSFEVQGFQVEFIPPWLDHFVPLNSATGLCTCR